ncbi:MAG: cell division protein FtsZ [Odoribacteraceae bacterium]|jgi:cell division protein FtsZ|nr:cell division protein FtsZ [Odoribacteraceae bacterium]
MISEVLNVSVPKQEASRIKVLGVGGGGCNAVNHMCYQEIKGVELVVCNTDIQALRQSPVRNRIQIGKVLTEGHGAGNNPEKGKESATETIDYIRSVLEESTDLLFIAVGMGGGTGTGAAPVIAQLAKELGILTVAIVTIPFYFEGRRRVEQALRGIEELNKHVDSLLIICNEKLREIHGNLKLSQAFREVDNVLSVAARSVAEIAIRGGKVKVGMNDVYAVLRNSGVALMGAGDAKGEGRAMKALNNALDSPLLNNSDIRGASKVLLNILYGDSECEPHMDEIQSMRAHLKALAKRDVEINWGYGRDKELGQTLRAVVIVSGFAQRSFDSLHSDKAPFQVEEVEDLEMTMEDSKNAENRQRRKAPPKAPQEQRHDARQEKEHPQKSPHKPKQGVNAPPRVDDWFAGLFGNPDSNMERDAFI